MSILRPILIAVLCVACRNAAQKPEHAVAADSMPSPATATTPVSTEIRNAPAVAADTPVLQLRESRELFREPPDSNTMTWRFPSIDNGNERFIGQAVRHPSGVLVIWFDTATRATEDTPAGTTHIDSVVVSGLRPGEYLTPYCNADGRHETWKSQIVGILRDTTNYLRPRMAWKLDTLSHKITAVPTDPVLCSAADLFGEDDDD